MRSTSEATKQDLHNELQLKYREFFESKLAVFLLDYASHFLSVKKISTAIVNLMETNKSIVINTIMKDSKIIAELREPYFGSCYDKKQTVSAEQVFEKILSILKEGSQLKNIMQIHCIFIHRIYDQIEKKPEKAALVSQIFPLSLFSKENRSRIEKKEEEIKETTQLGITHHRVFSKMLRQSDKNHIRALDRFQPDDGSDFFKSSAEKRVPVVCGASGHTGSLMLGVKLYGDLTSDELKEYTLAAFAFLAAGGNHSFYEVLKVANLVGIDFQIDDYSVGVPTSIKKDESYQTIKNQFPEFLPSDEFLGILFTK
ncbi:MAG TPA: hypothetical protein VHZ76_04920 [Gammaproteobacteria bacterium]|nr:hypothetical protein [Gammaproteobacteria bacterium]